MWVIQHKQGRHRNTVRILREYDLCRLVGEEPERLGGGQGKTFFFIDMMVSGSREVAVKVKAV